MDLTATASPDGRGPPLPSVRYAGAQIEALFDRHRTEVFPPPGPNRCDSFFARTMPPSQKPARLCVGLAAPGKEPKLIFL